MGPNKKNHRIDCKKMKNVAQTGTLVLWNNISIQPVHEQNKRNTDQSASVRRLISVFLEHVIIFFVLPQKAHDVVITSVRSNFGVSCSLEKYEEFFFQSVSERNRTLRL